MEELYIDNIVKMSPNIVKPIVIKAENSKEYVLKTRYDINGWGYKDLGIFLEAISYAISKLLNFKYIPEIVILNVDDDFIYDINETYDNGLINREVFDSIQNSKGLNIGIEKINTFPIQEIDNIDFINKSIYIDGIIMNNDRTKSNPNIIKGIKEDEYYLIDFGGSFDNNQVIIDCLDENIDFVINSYYDKKVFDDDYVFIQKLINFNEKFISISENDLNLIIDKTPKEWDNEKYKSEVATIISNRSQNSHIFGVRDE